MSKKTKQTISKPDSNAEEGIDYKDKYLRSLADYQNLLKRTEKEKAEGIAYANKTFIEKLLPVLDYLEQAVVHAQDDGVQLVYKELYRVLDELGVQKIELAPDAIFNPEYMECIEAEEKGNKLQVTRSGYRFKDKIVRPVQVKVILSTDEHDEEKQINEQYEN